MRVTPRAISFVSNAGDLRSRQHPRGVLPFGYFSLDKQGKVTRPTGRNLYSTSPYAE